MSFIHFFVSHSVSLVLIRFRELWFARIKSSLRWRRFFFEHEIAEINTESRKEINQTCNTEKNKERNKVRK